MKMRLFLEANFSSKISDRPINFSWCSRTKIFVDNSVKSTRELNQVPKSSPTTSTISCFHPQTTKSNFRSMLVIKPTIPNIILGSPSTSLVDKPNKHMLDLG